MSFPPKKSPSTASAPSRARVEYPHPNPRDPTLTQLYDLPLLLLVVGYFLLLAGRKPHDVVVEFLFARELLAGPRRRLVARPQRLAQHGVAAEGAPG